jgi:hypothetical protein
MLKIADNNNVVPMDSSKFLRCTNTIQPIINSKSLNCLGWRKWDYHKVPMQRKEQSKTKSNKGKAYRKIIYRHQEELKMIKVPIK